MAGVSYLGTAEVLFYRSNNLSQLRFYGIFLEELKFNVGINFLHNHILMSNSSLM